MNSSRNSDICLSNACQKKKKRQTQTHWVFQPNPNVALVDIHIILPMNIGMS